MGDYTRKLAAALINAGCEAAIIAINDRRMQDNIWQGKQHDNNTEINVLRMPESVSWNIRLNEAKKFAAAFQPDWLSLQYVPFGYQLKGLPFKLGEKLKNIYPGKPWHIMFHELSVNKNESFKFKIWALLQTKIIRSVLHILHPAVISTNTKLYQHRLTQLGYSSKVLPLFSNITRTEVPDFSDDKNCIPQNILQHRNEYIVGTLFGAFSFKSWDLKSLLNQLINGYDNKKIIIASIGRMSSGAAYWQQLQNEYPAIQFLTLGEQPEAFISAWLLHYTDFGILSTLPELAGKSGSFMAFKEHGIPVVCKEKTAELESFNIPLDKGLTEINNHQSFQLPKKYPSCTMLNEVVNQFLADLQNSQQSMINNHS